MLLLAAMVGAIFADDEVTSFGGLIFRLWRRRFRIEVPVTSADAFLLRFFPSFDWAAEPGGLRSHHQVLQLLILFAAYVTRAFGWRRSLFVAGIAFLVGTRASAAAALNLYMLIATRLFCRLRNPGEDQMHDVVVEMRASSLDFTLNACAALSVGDCAGEVANKGFQLMTTVGVIVANMAR